MFSAQVSRSPFLFHQFWLTSYSDEECGGGSVVVSYDASQITIPEKYGDETVAAQCLYFSK